MKVLTFQSVFLLFHFLTWLHCMLNGSGESGNCYLVPDLREGKHIQSFTITLMLTTGFINAFIRFRISWFISWFSVFIRNEQWILSDAFSAAVKGSIYIYILIHWFFCSVLLIHWFSNLEPTLNSCDKLHLVSPFIYWRILSDNILLRVFASVSWGILVYSFLVMTLGTWHILKAFDIFCQTILQRGHIDHCPTGFLCLGPFTHTNMFLLFWKNKWVRNVVLTV